MIKITEKELELIERIRNGDEKAFSTLFKLYYEPLYHFSLRYLHDWQASENVVQDIFVKIWISRTKLNIQTNLKAYLFTAVKNSSLNYIQQVKRNITIDQEKESIQDEQLKPDEKVIIKEHKNAIHAAINELPDRCRQIYIMKKYENLSYKEIAEILEISINTVKTQMKRAFKSLVEKLQYLKILLIILFSGV